MLLVYAWPVLAANFESADEYYEDALDLYYKKDFASAIIQLKNALQLDDRHLPAKILLGESYLGAGEPEAAIVQLHRARAQGDDENIVAVPIANSLLSQEKYQELEEYISRARRAPEVDSKLMVILGISYTQRQKFEKADQLFDRARQLAPENAEPLLAQASLALNNDDLNKVQNLVNLLRKIAPDNIDSWLLEGALLTRQNKPDLALAAFDRILLVNADYVTAKLRRSRILLDKDQFEIVIADLKPLWEEEFYEPELIYLYSMALARRGDTKLATQVLEEASRKIDYLGANLVDKHPSLPSCQLPSLTIKATILRPWKARKT